MKNLIEVLFEFKEKGSEVIDKNREKLGEMAEQMEKAAAQASYLINTQKEIDKSLKESTNVVALKTKADREADREKRKSLVEQRKLAKEQADQEKAAAKISADNAEKLANTERKKANIAKEAAQNASENARQQINAAKELAKADQDSSQMSIVQLGLKRAEERRLERERLAEARRNNATIAQDKKIADAQELARLKNIEAEEKQKFEAEKRNVKELINLEKQAAQAAQTASKKSEDSAKQEVAAKRQAVKAAQEVAKANEKAAQAAKVNSSSSGSSDGSSVKNDLSNLDNANNKMTNSLKSLKAVRLAVAGVAAAAVAAVAIYARRSADEFYKMKLAAENSGIDVRVLQEYKDVLDQVGISTDEFADKIRQLNEKFVEGFTENSGDGLEVIKTLNLEMEKFAKASPEKKFEMIVEATKDLNKSQRLQIFDKLSLDNLVLVANRMDQIQKKKEQIQRTGLVVTNEEADRLKTFENNFNAFNNQVSTFSTIIYSALIPALSDAFDNPLEDLELTRETANEVIESLVECVKFFAKLGAFAKLGFNVIIDRLKVVNLYVDQAIDYFTHLLTTMSISVKGVVAVLSNINIGEAIADLSKKTFSGIIDVVFEALDTITSGIQKVVNKISGVVPNAVLENINSSRAAISQARKNLFQYEESDVSKQNKKIAAQLNARNQEEIKEENQKWQNKQKIAREALEQLNKDAEKTVKEGAEKIEKIDLIDPKKYTISKDKALKDQVETGNKDLKLLGDGIEQKNAEIDKILQNADNIRKKIELNILKEDGSKYTYNDYLLEYDKAIALAASDAKLLNKELELRVNRQKDEVEFYKDIYQKQAESVKSSLQNLKTLDEINEKPFDSKNNILEKYDQLIKLAKDNKQTESDINQLVLERKQYIDSYNESQKKYITELDNLETNLMQAQEKNQELRAKRRAKALAEVNETFKNATTEQKDLAVNRTNQYYDITDAKERVQELNEEIEKLNNQRLNETSITDRQTLLSLETQINSKVKERESLEDKLGIKRKKTNSDFVFTLSTVQSILENTYTNFTTLINSAVSGVDSLKDATKKFFNDTLNYIAQLFQKILVMKALNLIGSSFGFTLPSSGGPGTYHEGGSTKRATDGAGVFDSFGPIGSNEMTAILNQNEAVLNETQQQNLGNYLANSGNSGNVTAVIHNNIDLPSLVKGIVQTQEFREGTKNTITKDRSTYKQVLS